MPETEQQMKRRQRRAEEALEIDRRKEALAQKHGLERTAKFERAWEIAWDYGHSNGFSEVEGYFDELADLLKP